MNAMLSMGIEGNVYEARSVEDTYTHYSGAQRAGSAVIDFLGVNLGSAIADVANTGRANREAASVSAYTGFIIPKSLIVNDMQQSYLNVRAFIADEIKKAVSSDHDDIEFHGVYSYRFNPSDINFMLGYTDSTICPQAKALYRRPNEWDAGTFLFGFDGQFVDWCQFTVEIKSVLEPAPELGLNDSYIVKTALRNAQPLYSAIYRHANAISFIPHRYSENRVNITNQFPYVAYKGEARLFTRDNATTPINKPNL